ncbi:hypothetical protein GWI33_007678 [Rhynchophorus ferrugineus]|uniref:15-hydroxyprostaglandin dehydrogenase n=1 Tax=Rhynchophorus ferrugineus TaxID=354439 RepID=A0A834IJH3_RHYFE|nr:hypothetical protein GWI33_007678 [Rhynchophorus ferrugineus]
MAKEIKLSGNLKINNMESDKQKLKYRNFNIEGKVALVTGGASGLGHSFVKNLLEQGIRGITIVDINSSLGETVCAELKKKHGNEKVIFFKADVVDKEQFEGAFKETLATFGAIDILINNAGILNEQQWLKEISINITGTINGILLGLEHYIQKYKSGPEGVIVNVCSVSAVGGPIPFPVPIYTCSKFAVHGLTITFGCIEHYQRTGVRIVAICPGITDTPIIDFNNFGGIFLGKPYSDLTEFYIKTHTIQKPESCASALIQIIKKAPTGTLWISEGDQKPYQYEIPDRFSIPKVYLE